MDDLQSILDAWDRAGLASGHAWAPCDACKEIALMPRAEARRCCMTPGCKGKHRPPKDRPTPLAALRAGLVTPEEILRHMPAMGPALRKLLARKLEEGR